MRSAPVFLLFFFQPAVLWASSFELHIQKPFPVYKTQNLKKSNRLKMLQPGDRVLISPQEYGHWKKLLLVSEGDPLTGWAFIKHLEGRAKIEKVKTPEEVLINALENEILPMENQEEAELMTSGVSPYSQGFGIGLSAHISYMVWGSRTFTLSDQTDWTVSEVNSTTYWPSAFIDLNLSQHRGVRAYFGYRTTDFKGQSKADLLTTAQTSFQQEFLSLGIIYKIYGGIPNFWWGPGFEGAQGQEVTITYNNEVIPTTKEDLAIFLSGFLSAGYEYSITSQIYALPELRLGSTFNQDPHIILVEGVLSISYLF